MLNVPRAVKYVALAFGVSTSAGPVSAYAANKAAEQADSTVLAAKASTSSKANTLDHASLPKYITDSTETLLLSDPFLKLDATLRSWIRLSPVNCTGHPNANYQLAIGAIEAELDFYTSTTNRGKGLRLWVITEYTSKKELDALVEGLSKQYGVKPQFVDERGGILGFFNFPLDKQLVYSLALHPDVRRIELPEGDRK